MASRFTRTFTCSLYERSRMQFLTRDCKRVARIYGGEYGSNAILTGSAEYRITFPTQRVLEVVSALRRRKGRR